jgi:hypothetical protein
MVSLFHSTAQRKAYAINGSDYCFWHDPFMMIKIGEDRRKEVLNRRALKPSQNEVR